LISAGADKIFSNEMSRTGSIGAYMLRFDLSGALRELGINVEHLDGPSNSGKFWQESFADINANRRVLVGNLFRPTTYGMRVYLSKRCLETYEDFKSHVAKGRKLTLPEVEQLAQGRVYTGAQAKDVGLVDEVGGLEEALQYVYEKHDIQEEDTIVLEFPTPKPLSLSDIVAHALTEHQNSPSTSGWMSRMTSSLAISLGIMGGTTSSNDYDETPPTAIEDLDFLRWVQGISSKKQLKDLAAVNAATDVMLLADDKTALNMALKQFCMD
jgi:ClpP class serine protease